MRQGMLPAVFGLVFGVLGAWAATRSMQGLLFEVSATDSVSFAIAVATLGAIALAATALPARRAASVDPIAALRSE